MSDDVFSTAVAQLQKVKNAFQNGFFVLLAICRYDVLADLLEVCQRDLVGQVIDGGVKYSRDEEYGFHKLSTVLEDGSYENVNLKKQRIFIPRELMKINHVKFLRVRR